MCNVLADRLPPLFLFFDEHIELGLSSADGNLRSCSSLQDVLAELQLQFILHMVIMQVIGVLGIFVTAFELQILKVFELFVVSLNVKNWALQPWRILFMVVLDLSSLLIVGARNRHWRYQAGLAVSRNGLRR